jgi:hypothetical protein
MSTGARPVTPRQWLLALSLGATVAACLWVAQLPPDEVESAAADLARPTARSGASGRPASQANSRPAPSPSWTLPAREAWSPAEPTSLAAWQDLPPPPAPVAQAVSTVPPVAVAALQAPPFPYQLIGRLDEAGRRQALLGSDQRSLAVQVGDTIDGQWRVKAIGDDTLELLWLPGPLPQTLRFKPL